MFCFPTASLRYLLTYLLGVKSHTAMPSKRVATYQYHHRHQYNDHRHHHHHHHHYDQAKESQHLRVDPSRPLLAPSTATSGVPNAAGKPKQHCFFLVFVFVLSYVPCASGTQNTNNKDQINSGALSWLLTQTNWQRTQSCQSLQTPPS